MKYITVRILRWCVRVCELQLSATECFCHFNVYFHKTQNPRNHFTSHPAFVSLRNGSIQNVSNAHSHKPIRSLVRTQRHKPCTHSLSKYIIWLIIMHALRLIIIRSSGFFSLFLSLSSIWFPLFLVHVICLYLLRMCMVFSYSPSLVLQQIHRRNGEMVLVLLLLLSWPLLVFH